MHEVVVKNEGEAIRGTPHFLRSMPKSKKDYDGKPPVINGSIYFNYCILITGIEPCSVGSTVEVLINPHHAARPELLEASGIMTLLH